jgi:hypothetical protein
MPWLARLAGAAAGAARRQQLQHGLARAGAGPALTLAHGARSFFSGPRRPRRRAWPPDGRSASSASSGGRDGLGREDDAAEDSVEARRERVRFAKGIQELVRSGCHTMSPEPFVQAARRVTNLPPGVTRRYLSGFILNGHGNLLAARGDMSQAVPLLKGAFEHAVEEATQGLGDDKYSDIVSFASDLAIGEAKVGRIASAEKLIKRAMYWAGSSRAGPDRALNTATLSNMGLLQGLARKQAASLDSLERAAESDGGQDALVSAATTLGLSSALRAANITDRGVALAVDALRRSLALLPGAPALPKRSARLSAQGAAAVAPAWRDELRALHAGMKAQGLQQQLEQERHRQLLEQQQLQQREQTLTPTFEPPPAADVSQLQQQQQQPSEQQALKPAVLPPTASKKGRRSARTPVVAQVLTQAQPRPAADAAKGGSCNLAATAQANLVCASALLNASLYLAELAESSQDIALAHELATIATSFPFVDKVPALLLQGVTAPSEKTAFGFFSEALEHATNPSVKEAIKENVSRLALKTKSAVLKRHILAAQEQPLPPQGQPPLPMPPRPSQQSGKRKKEEQPTPPAAPPATAAAPATTSGASSGAATLPLDDPVAALVKAVAAAAHISEQAAVEDLAEAERESAVANGAVAGLRLVPLNPKLSLWVQELTPFISGYTLLKFVAAEDH